MSGARPETYIDLALAEVPRILSLQDRNPFSPAYGCFHRSYWLHRTSDFPSAIAQQGVHVLALVWAHELKDNPYYRDRKILEWCLAGIRYWIRIQKDDGSFDEWYPNERGWAGPTGHLLHAMVDSYFLLGKEFPADLLPEFRKTVEKAARFLIRYDEKHVLANHHAIALLPIYDAYLLLKDESILAGFHRRYEEFLTLCDPEGWCLEYDGPDIGYLSGTVSFLTRIYRHWPDARMKAVIERAIEFSSYFLYPDGFFGGSIGSRETAHFYHYGYEFWARRDPSAAAMAEQGLAFLAEGGLIGPGVQEDHYVLYRVPEFIEAYLEWAPRESLEPLPFARPDFEAYYPTAGIFVQKKTNRYLVVNLRRGGVVKIFDCGSARLLHADNGWIAELADGQVVTSQWNGPYGISRVGNELRVDGHAQYVVTRLFTPLKMALFRLFMIVAGNNAKAAYHIKSVIRRLLMVGNRPAPLSFERTVSLAEEGVVRIRDRISALNGAKVSRLQRGGDFKVRFVPQSRYFQLCDLTASETVLTAADIEGLNSRGTAVFETEITG
jgi:hypothetical protein